MAAGGPDAANKATVAISISSPTMQGTQFDLIVNDQKVTFTPGGTNVVLMQWGKLTLRVLEPVPA